MEYYPSDFDMQMQRFFNMRRRALRRINELGLSMPYISEKLTYEQLLSNYMVLDKSNSETEYLKNGIKALFECLKDVQKVNVISREEAENQVYINEKGRLEDYISEKGKDEHITTWINGKVEDIIKTDASSKKITEEVLIREISEFKTRLARVNVLVIVEQDTLNFKKSDKMIELHIYEKEVLENPYPHIFVNTDAFVLFNDLHSIYKDIENPLANYSFIYRQMSKDNLIKDTFKPEKFRDWINSEPYNLEVDTKLKTYDNCYTKEKYNTYQFAKSKQ
tara:strand:+ start:289 stop:1122 length:834 start_codon:yes stop_codon:yes gene_type:complete